MSFVNNHTEHYGISQSSTKLNTTSSINDDTSKKLTKEQPYENCTYLQSSLELPNGCCILLVHRGRWQYHSSVTVVELCFNVRGSPAFTNHDDGAKDGALMDS